MNNNEFKQTKWLHLTSRQIFLIFLVIVGFYLITEHTAYIFRALPYGLLLLCPLLHLFMHGDHVGRSPQSQRKSQSNSPQNPSESRSDHTKGHVH